MKNNGISRIFIGMPLFFYAFSVYELRIKKERRVRGRVPHDIFYYCMLCTEPDQYIPPPCAFAIAAAAAASAAGSGLSVTRLSVVRTIAATEEAF